ncbi:MAG TPA: DICT sensory domain-containing protein, partial [Acidimicrobiales bacterium]
RTHVSVPVLRAWELRYGFPEPGRSPSGHRRYSERDVELIAKIVRERQAGLSLEAAIDRVRRIDDEVEPSIFAGLRRARPELDVHVLSKRAMLAISRAIEDECCARADRPVLLAGFQRERFYRQSEARWRDLAGTAAVAVAFADFPETRLRSDEGMPHEVALDREAPFLREWAIVCDSLGSAACLTGWERPGQGHLADGDRLFEAVWSVEPAVVRRAAHIGLGLARRHAPDLTGLSDELADDLPLDGTVAVRRATALTNRVVAYLEGLQAAGR